MDSQLARKIAEVFAFLERDFGFEHGMVRDDHMSFRKAGLELRLSQEAGSGDLAVLFESHGQLFDLRDVADWAGVNLPGLQYPDLANVDNGLRRIASFLKKWARPVLTIDAATIDHIEQCRDARDRAYNRKMSVQPAREQAERAWQEHDYRAVVSLLASIEGSLSPSEKRRLRIAMQRQ